MKSGYESVRDWRRNTKRKLVEGFGGCCAVCAIVDDPCIYDIHHLDPSKKDFSIASKIRSWTVLVEEASKCVLLCAPCHRKFHAGIVALPDPTPSFDEERAAAIDKKCTQPCPVCGLTKPVGQITCSRSCASKRRINGNVALADIVKLYAHVGTYSAVASQLGISDVTVRKRLIESGVVKAKPKT